MKKTILLLSMIFTFLLLASCSKSTTLKPTTSANPTTSSLTSPTTTITTKAPTTVTTLKPTEAPTEAPTVTVDENDELNKQLQAAYLNSFKVLAIGNSFSDDAFTYLYDIANAYGVKEVIIANLYIGGCTIETHYNNTISNAKAYTYKKCVNGVWSNRTTSMLEGIVDEEWDIISLQQASGSSGMEFTYKSNQINAILDYALANCSNENVRLAWHMTWAYQKNSTHQEFPNYNKNQELMYDYIKYCVKRQILTNNKFTYIIPAGTAVQNARTSYFGDTLTQDGYHLNQYGDMIAGLMWFKTLTNVDLDTIDITKIDSALKNHLAVFKESVRNAYDLPYQVTTSLITEEPNVDSINLDNYTLFDYNPIQGYWYSTSDKYDTVFSTSDTTSKKYYCSETRFTKEDIPVGSIIICEKGFMYRPEAWTGDTKPSVRKNEVTEYQVLVDEDYWTGFKYRAFNISKVGKPDIIGLVDDIKAGFKIYIPKSS